MKRTLWKWSTLMLATAAMAQGATAQFGQPGADADAVIMAAPESSLPRVMSYDEKKLRTLFDSGIPGLKFYPRVSGSTSTIPVGQLLVAKALRLPGELRRLPPAPTPEFRNPYSNPYASSILLHRAPLRLQMTFPLSIDPRRLQEYSTLAARNTHRQTSGSYMALAQDAADLILVARQPLPDELVAAQENNMSFDVRPVALDALVFIANRQNAVDNLTLKQVRDIYTGAIKNWKDVGGLEEPIGARTRDRNSGSEELMTKLVMGDRNIIEGGDRMIIGMAGVLDAVEQDKNALAYSVFYYERVMNPRLTLKPLAIDGVVPSTQTIGDRTYPLVEPVYVVTRQGIKADEPAAVLRDWLLSPDGQKLIVESGYAPFRK